MRRCYAEARLDWCIWGVGITAIWCRSLRAVWLHLGPVELELGWGRERDDPEGEK